jgi:hypothetical protein
MTQPHSNKNNCHVPPILDYLQKGYFVTERRFISTFLEGRKPERRSGTFFRGIGITNIPLSDRILCHYALRSLFLNKKYHCL